MPKLKLIAAVGKNNELGKNNSLPLWNLKTDFKRLKELTMGHTIVMGKNTFYSLPEKFRPMPGRRNVILSKDKNLEIQYVQIFHSIPKLMEGLKDEKEIWIFGGANIYQQFIDLVDELHITHVDGDFDADVFFPKINPEIWKIVSEKKVPKDEKNSHDSVYTIYHKK